MFSASKTFLLLSAHTGNGHSVAAAAVAEAIREQGHKAEIDYPIEGSGRLNRWIAGTYNRALQRYPNRMHWYFKTVNRLKPDRQMLRFKRVRSSGLEFLRQYKPDMVVSFHPMTNHPFALICAMMEPRIPVACVVTDPYPPFWEGWTCPQVDRFFVATGEAAAQLRAGGISNDRITESGLPVQPAFERRQGSGRDWRLQNGLDPEKFTLFLNAGWLGNDDFLELYRGMARAGLPVQVAYLHGERQRSRAAKLARSSTISTVLMERTPCMHRWMQASDLMVSKPGALTMFEAFASELPVAVNALSAIMPQEIGLAESIRSRRLGFWVRSPAELAGSVRRFLEKPAELRELRSNIGNFYKRGAAARIAGSILEMAGAAATEADPVLGEVPAFSA